MTGLTSLSTMPITTNRENDVTDFPTLTPDQQQRRVDLAFIGDAVRQLEQAEAAGDPERVLMLREYLRRSIGKLQACAGLQQ